LVEDGGQAIVLNHQADGRTVIEMVDDLFDVLGESVDIRTEILLKQRMIFVVHLF